MRLGKAVEQYLGEMCSVCPHIRRVCASKDFQCCKAMGETQQRIDR